MLSRPRPSVRPSASSVILGGERFRAVGAGRTKDAAALMKRAGEDVSQKWQVSKRVNRSRAPDDDASPIESIEKPGAAVLALHA
jgi:hypothetical protein